MENNLFTEKSDILYKVFTPSSPIQDNKFFAGRIPQITSLMSIIQQNGMHGILYGERGVGKTSLANIINILVSTNYIGVKISCDHTDDYSAVWRKVFSALTISCVETKNILGFQSKVDEKINKIPLSNLLSNGDIKPIDVSNLLSLLKQNVLIIFDEFDRVGHFFDYKIFSDTMKSLSDNTTSIHLLIVGVSDSVTTLIKEHKSIERNISQVLLPVMSSDELHEILLKGLNELNMSIEEPIKNQIVKFSSGYPHFTHLLALRACECALSHNSNHVDNNDFNYAVEKAIDQTHESLREGYQKATLTTKQSMFKEVLWACSVADVDENGTFQATDLVIPLSKILNKKITVNHFIYVLTKLTTSERGNILLKIGVKKRYRYKYVHPLMKAFVELIKYKESKPLA